jgi:hypothetical protein
MDGIGLPIIGFLLGTIFSLICWQVPPLRRFALAALVSPVVSSVVFLFGSWILSDMNPCVEYGYSCIPKGGHDPTGLDTALWLICVAVAFFLNGAICFKVQKFLPSR